MCVCVDEEWVNIKNEFKTVYVVIPYAISDEVSKIDEIKRNFDKAKASFGQVEKQQEGAPDDPYIEKMRQFLTLAGKQIEDIDRNLANIQKVYAESCEYYMFEKSDDKCAKSEEYFKFFTNFVEQVVKAMPKEEKKRPNKDAGAGAGAAKKFNQLGGAGQKTNAAADLMAELKMKQGQGK